MPFKVRECHDAGEHGRCEHLAAAHGRAQPLSRHPKYLVRVWARARVRVGVRGRLGLGLGSGFRSGSGSGSGSGLESGLGLAGVSAIPMLGILHMAELRAGVGQVDC